MRFIDYSSDGGCSKKASASELDEMLAVISKKTESTTLRVIQSHLPDCGEFILGTEKTYSSVDIIFPMINDPTLFGKIVVNHVLNDLYASLAIPKFALAIVGVPRSLSLTSPAVVEMMLAANLALNEQFIPVIGGHSLAHQEDLFLGFTVVGTPMIDSAEKIHAEVGDEIFMTKRVGTNIASIRWKLDLASIEDHQDVLDGMLKSNREAAQISSRLGISHCTDISGFGLINNLTTLLRRVNLSAKIDISLIPIYQSVASHTPVDETLCTRQFYHNAEHFKKECKLDFSQYPGASAWLDSQTSGGLLFICPRAKEHDLQKEFETRSIEITKIGSVTKKSFFPLELAT